MSKRPGATSDNGFIFKNINDKLEHVQAIKTEPFQYSKLII
jgi:hypothetical protein